MKTTEELVRACFRAYEEKDRAAIERLLAKDFVFSSPWDDRISRERYLERCWPLSETVESFRIERVFAQGDEAYVTYEGKRTGEAPNRNTEFFRCRAGQVVEVQVFFGNETGSDPDTEKEIGEKIEDWAAAIGRKDVEGVMGHFAEDAVMFELAPPLQMGGDPRENLAKWFETFPGKIRYEVHQLRVATGGDVAYAHGLVHLVGKKGNGEADAEVWFRITLGLRRVQGQWGMAHVHESVPFYMDGSLKAAVDLRPEPEG